MPIISLYANILLAGRYMLGSNNAPKWGFMTFKHNFSKSRHSSNMQDVTIKELAWYYSFCS